mgnify:CR=1 FL=1
MLLPFTPRSAESSCARIKCLWESPWVFFTAHQLPSSVTSMVAPRLCHAANHFLNRASEPRWCWSRIAFAWCHPAFFPAQNQALAYALLGNYLCLFICTYLWGWGTRGVGEAGQTKLLGVSSECCYDIGVLQKSIDIHYSSSCLGSFDMFPDTRSHSSSTGIPLLIEACSGYKFSE